MSTYESLVRSARFIADTLSDWESSDYYMIHEEEEGEAPTAYDYLTDALDIEYRVNGNHEYRSGRIMVTYGGPNIYVDTSRRVIEGYWGSDSVEVPYDDSLGLDDALEELFHMTR